MRRRYGRLLAVGSLVASVAFPLVMSPPVSAGSEGGSDLQNGAIDTAFHPQNSFRPPTPYATYQRRNVTELGDKMFDMTAWDFQAGIPDGSGGFHDRFKMSITVGSALPRPGDSPLLMPATFTEVQYAWYIQTTMQNSKQKVGVDCIPTQNFGEGNATFQGPLLDSDPFGTGDPGNNQIPDRWTLMDFTAIAGSDECKKAALSDIDGDGRATRLENEQVGKAESTNAAIAQLRNIYEVPHPAIDGWWMVFSVDLVTAADGADGLRCRVDPATGQRYPVCLRYVPNWGIYEGYSGFQSTLSGLDSEDGGDNYYITDVDGNPANGLQSVGSPFTVTLSTDRKTITMEAPYQPKILNGIDGDEIADDLQSWPTNLGAPGQDVTAVVAETAGVQTAGGPQACGALDGGLNALDDLAGTGESDNCVGTGFDNVGLGLLTIRDWAPENGFELRQAPRQPGYLPNPDSPNAAFCRYPIGHFPAAPAAVTIAPVPQAVSLGPDNSGGGDMGSTISVSVPGQVGYDTTPFTRRWWIHSQSDQGPLTGLNPTRVEGVALSGAPLHQPTGVGRDVACGYQRWTPGLHYNDVMTDFNMD